MQTTPTHTLASLKEISAAVLAAFVLAMSYLQLLCSGDLPSQNIFDIAGVL
jgi:hypothetical protein